MDNLVTGGVDRIRDLLVRPGFHFVRGDAASALARYPVNGCPPRITHVWALAGVASPIQYYRRPVETASAVASALPATLEFALDHAARFLWFSSSEVAGASTDGQPLTETHVGGVSPVNLRSAYTEGKRFGEALTAAYWRASGLDARIVRLFNIFGPSLPPADGRVIPAFLGAALRGEAIVVHGDGTQTRSFCYVDDAVRGLLALMDASAATFRSLKPDPPIVNLGNPEEISMADLARLCWRVAGTGEARIVLSGGNPDDLARRCPDISRARELLRWAPRVHLEEGLRRTADWIREVS